MFGEKETFIFLMSDTQFFTASFSRQFHTQIKSQYLKKK